MLSGGEDYELCFTVPELNRGALEVALGQPGYGVYLHRQISADVGGLNFTQDGKAVTLDWKGYHHFG
ncbi:hypothetical protein ACNKHO_02285 [Shigella flexneri]